MATVPPRCWWTETQLVDWYRGKMEKVSRVKVGYSARNQEFEAWTRAFHVGLKLLEHWNIWKTSMYVGAIARQGGPPLVALKKHSKFKTGRFQSEEVTKGFNAAGELDERTQRKIKEYTAHSHSSSLNSPMSTRGKAHLRQLYRFITKELGRGRDVALQDALCGDPDSPSLFISRAEL